MIIFYKNEKEIVDLISAFNNRTLPKSEWTHHAHLTTAIWHLKNFELNDAICRIKSGIISYNLASGGENHGHAGYHETITLFWMDLIHIYLSISKGQSLVDICNSFLNSNLSDKNLPFEFYDKEYLMSSEARARFVKPDKLEMKEEVIAAFIKMENV